MFESRRKAGLAVGAGILVVVLFGAGVAAALVGVDDRPEPGTFVTATAPDMAVAPVVPETVTIAAPTTVAAAPPPTTVTTPAAPKAVPRPARPPRPTTTVPVVEQAAQPAATVTTLAARRTPSAAEVQSAIQGISSMVTLPLFFSITPEYVAQFGDQVCDAFDQGQSFAQVKATGLAAVSKYISVSDAAADYAVRKAVSLYCPGYASKLS